MKQIRTCRLILSFGRDWSEASTVGLPGPALRAGHRPAAPKRHGRRWEPSNRHGSRVSLAWSLRSLSLGAHWLCRREREGRPGGQGDGTPGATSDDPAAGAEMAAPFGDPGLGVRSQGLEAASASAASALWTQQRVCPVSQRREWSSDAVPCLGSQHRRSSSLGSWACSQDHVSFPDSEGQHADCGLEAPRGW